MYVEDIEEPTTGPAAESKTWLERNGIMDAKWATVVDPFIKFVFTTDGRVQGEPMD